MKVLFAAALLALAWGCGGSGASVDTGRVAPIPTGAPWQADWETGGPTDMEFGKQYRVRLWQNVNGTLVQNFYSFYDLEVTSGSIQMFRGRDGSKLYSMLPGASTGILHMYPNEQGFGNPVLSIPISVRRGPTYTAQVHVTDANGQPPSDTIVEISFRFDNGMAVPYKRVDAAGNASFELPMNTTDIWIYDYKFRDIATVNGVQHDMSFFHFFPIGTAPVDTIMPINVVLSN